MFKAMRIRRFPWKASLALAISFVVHYLVYAYRFMWYLSYPDFVLLVEIYLAFMAIVVAEFIFFPTWWLMGVTAFALMFMPAVVRINYMLLVGILFYVVALVSACPFVVVAFLRKRSHIKIG